jgi:dethiobiotin synthetase
VRPARLVVVTGTGTEVGKTWVASRLAERLRRAGLIVAARKPAQSYAPGEVTDAEILGRSSGEPAETVCPRHRWYPLPMAPPMAADSLGLEAPDIATLVAETEAGWPDRADVGMVEGAGGVASPLGSDGDTASLVRALRPDTVVLVGDPALGILNQSRLGRMALPGFRLVVHLNRFDARQELHRRNIRWMSERDGFEVTSDLDGLAAAVSA